MSRHWDDWEDDVEEDADEDDDDEGGEWRPATGMGPDTESED